MSSIPEYQQRERNTEYNRYYNSVIILRRENTQKVVKKVMPIIDKIMNEANEQDPRFAAQPYRMGSYYQGLKIKRADEFDLNVPLQGLGEYQWGKQEPSYYGFDKDTNDDQLKNYPDDIRVVSKGVPLPPPPAGFTRIDVSETRPLWQKPKREQLVFDEHIIPFLVRRHYRKLVQAAIRKYGLMGAVFVSHRRHGPAITLNIKLASLAHAVSVDLSPVIENNLSPHSSCGFPHPGAQWPSQETTTQMLQVGTSRTAHHDFEWRWSFVKQEALLLKGMDADGGCRKKVQRILKGLQQDVWATATDSALTSYHLKNLLFWECEKYPDSRDWEQERLAERIHGIISQLQHAIRKRSITLFMNKEINLLENADRATLDMEAKRIESFLRNPRQILMAKSG